MKKAVVVVASGLAVLSLSGCPGVADSILGPSCGDFLGVDEVAKQEMVLEWMVEKDLAPDGAKMTDQGSLGILPLGTDVMGYVQAFKSKCAADEGARLNDFNAY